MAMSNNIKIRQLILDVTNSGTRRISPELLLFHCDQWMTTSSELYGEMSVRGRAGRHKITSVIEPDTLEDGL